MLGPRRRKRKTRKLISPRLGWRFERCRRELENAPLRVVKVFNHLKVMVAELEDEGEFQVLSRRTPFLYVEDDLPVSICDSRARVVSGLSSQEIPWGIKHIRALDVTSPNRSVKVAVLDTGVESTHPDLEGCVAGGFNTIEPGQNPSDGHGHGTHVAGIIAALNNDFGVVGVDPGLQLYAVKVLGDSGNGHLSDVIEGLEWCVASNIAVVNMSLSTSKDSRALHTAIKAAYKAGCVLVAAAGNSGPDWDTVEYPARYPEVIAVGAINEKNEVAGFSSRGKQVDIFAPGEDILSTWPGGKYARKDGTSMAAPHVAGTVALMLAAAENLPAGQVKKCLIRAAKGKPGGETRSRAGVLDTKSAVAQAENCRR